MQTINPAKIIGNPYTFFTGEGKRQQISNYKTNYYLSCFFPSDHLTFNSKNLPAEECIRRVDIYTFIHECIDLYVQTKREDIFIYGVKATIQEPIQPDIVYSVFAQFNLERLRSGTYLIDNHGDIRKGTKKVAQFQSNFSY